MAAVALGIGCSLVAAFLIWLLKRPKSTEKSQTLQYNASPNNDAEFSLLSTSPPRPRRPTTRVLRIEYASAATGAETSWNSFSMLGVQSVLGRTFSLFYAWAGTSQLRMPSTAGPGFCACAIMA